MPVLVATTLLGEGPASLGDATPLVLSVVAVCIGKTILAGSRHVSSLEAGAMGGAVPGATR